MFNPVFLGKSGVEFTWLCISENLGGSRPLHGESSLRMLDPAIMCEKWENLATYNLLPTMIFRKNNLLRTERPVCLKLGNRKFTWMAFFKKLSMDLRRAALWGRHVIPVLGPAWQLERAPAVMMEEEDGTTMGRAGGVGLGLTSILSSPHSWPGGRGRRRGRWQEVEERVP